MDAGHYVSRKHNSIRYYEKNVHAQCRKCNRYDEGNKSGYTRFLQVTYGQTVIALLDELGHKTKQFRVPELQELIKLYKTLLARMK